MVGSLVFGRFLSGDKCVVSGTASPRMIASNWVESPSTEPSGPVTVIFNGGCLGSGLSGVRSWQAVAKSSKLPATRPSLEISGRCFMALQGLIYKKIPLDVLTGF